MVTFQSQMVIFLDNTTSMSYLCTAIVLNATLIAV